MSGFNEADRRFVRLCRRWLAAAFLVYFGLHFVLQRHPAGLAGQVVAGTTGAAFFLVLLLTGLLVARSGDEFGRVLLLRSLLWATGVTMLAVCVWGFVEAFSAAPAAHAPLLFVPALLVLAMTVAKLLIFRRAR